jgi:tRNA pseudouridine55 synthase
MEDVLVYYKRPGETPLEALKRLRQEKQFLAEETLSYAGRLDPLADGELLVLIGDACSNREKYLSLDKTYVVDVLFGISTDTGDVLGKISRSVPVDEDSIKRIAAELPATLSGLLGKRMQAYPAYSSKPHKGKPLHEHARSGTFFPEDEMPTKEIAIYSIQQIGFRTMRFDELQAEIVNMIGGVKGDFRQAEILKVWDDFFSGDAPQAFLVATIEVHCSSGAYMRTLAEDIGKKAGMPALVLHIHRKKIHLG